VSRRPRWAAVATSLALLAAYGAGSWLHAEAATSSQNMPDATGDATARVDANGNPTNVPNEPKADVVAASATYQAGAIVFSVKTANPVNAASDASWGQSVVTWFVDITGDRKFDFTMEWGADNGGLYADIYDTGDSPICAGQGQASIAGDGSYVLTVKPGCFGNPSAFNWGGRTEFASGGESIMDRFPDGDGNYFGPVSKPGATTPPTQPGGGGTVPPPTTPPTTAPKPIETVPVASNEGFWLLGKDGGVFSFGTAQYFGSIGHLAGAKPVVSMAADPDGTGYWFVGPDGGIFAYKAPFWGSTGSIKLTRPIVGMAPTPSGKGYWMVASDGGIFAFGDAGFFGSTGAIKLNKPIVGMSPTPSGKGYWLVASDGGIFAFGDAKFFGSTGSMTLNEPIVGMASAASGKGYWFVARDGGVFNFGDAQFFGSAVNGNPSPVVGMSATKAGMGYRVARADGSITFFGNAGAGGGLTGSLAAPIVAIATAS
jgi:ribosomal protein L24E